MSSPRKRLRKLKYVDDETSVSRVGCDKRCICKGGSNKCNKDECDCILTELECECSYSPLEYSFLFCPGSFDTAIIVYRLWQRV